MLHEQIRGLAEGKAAEAPERPLWTLKNQRNIEISMYVLQEGGGFKVFLNACLTVLCEDLQSDNLWVGMHIGFGIIYICIYIHLHRSFIDADILSYLYIYSHQGVPYKLCCLFVAFALHPFRTSWLSTAGYIRSTWRNVVRKCKSWKRHHKMGGLSLPLVNSKGNTWN